MGETLYSDTPPSPLTDSELATGAFLTRAQASAYLGVSDETLSRRMRAKPIPIHACASNWKFRYFRRTDLDTLGFGKKPKAQPWSETKVCKRCGKTKLLVAFNLGEGACGRRATCKECSSEARYAAQGGPRRRRKQARRCAYCGKEFVPKSHGRSSRYCSKSCAARERAKAQPDPTRTCMRCGEVFSIRLADGTLSQKKLCPSCGATKSRGRTAEFTCEVCGKRFRIFHAQVRKGSGRFCSRACAHPPSASDPTGAFTNGLYGQNWPEQSRLARERDDYTCLDCGLRQEQSAHHVHHLRPRKAFGYDYIAANDLGNLVTLCASCHIRREMFLRREYRRRARSTTR